jgi:hypothetical protein
MDAWSSEFSDAVASVPGSALRRRAGVGDAVDHVAEREGSRS